MTSKTQLESVNNYMQFILRGKNIIIDNILILGCARTPHIYTRI